MEHEIAMNNYIDKLFVMKTFDLFCGNICLQQDVI